MAWTKQGNIKGDKGDAGPKGAQGVPGVAGNIGPVGTTGGKGPTGATGPTGGRGLKGDSGLTPEIKSGTWWVGKTNTHVTAQGATGHKGDAGAKGLKGDTGSPGTTGHAGVAGAKGDKGNTGPVGPKGSAGTGVSIKGSLPKADILTKSGSAGDMWLITSSGADHGHGLVSNGQGSGSANWTDVGAIQGPQGARGVAGAKGSTGSAGAKGADGINWHLVGRDTEAHIKTKTGIPGDMWIIEEPGHAKDGHALGWDPLLKPKAGWRDMGQFKGDKGDRGPIGHTGPVGSKGATGTIGKRGSEWFTGSSVPGNVSTSAVGDMYLDTSTGDVYKRS